MVGKTRTILSLSALLIAAAPSFAQNYFQGDKAVLGGLEFGESPRDLVGSEVQLPRRIDAFAPVLNCSQVQIAPYNQRRRTPEGRTRLHKGPDLRAREAGTDVFAAKAGVLEWGGPPVFGISNQGNQNGLASDGCYVVRLVVSPREVYVYRHLSRYTIDNLQYGQRIEEGGLIAQIGDNCRRSSANHLHLELLVDGRYQDPMPSQRQEEAECRGNPDLWAHIPRT